MHNSNLIAESKNNLDISEWSQNDVQNWLKDLNLSNLSSNFEENKINGYDLCMINSIVLKDELKINSFHDRNIILKSIKEYLYCQFKFKIKLFFYLLFS